MISPTLDSLRVALHILAVAVWLGGQIVLAAIVPKVRSSAPDALSVIARSFARVAWPAMFVIVCTGIWGLLEESVSGRTSSYLTTLFIKLLMVGVAIAATIIHSMGDSKMSKALGGALGLLGSLVAAYCGVLLAHVG